MCGVCGLVALDGGRVDRDVLAAMNESLVHRGPDSGGIYVNCEAGLAARRLAIIDLAGGDQPIGNEDGRITVVQNGEIYNYRELRAELERAGHVFRTNGDTEVLVHLYEERGLRFAEALRGMFAVAIWDAGRRRLVLARDRFGIKPLYYGVRGGTLAFASELKALVRHSDISREVDRDALSAYLTFGFVPAPLTIFAGARKLPAGSLLVASPEGGVRVERYARPRAAAVSELRREDEGELAEELLERLRDSVRAHLIADVPVGVLLSGGIDSSMLTALAAQEASGTVSTFSIGFDERQFDERPRARLVAERYGTDHHELVLRPDVVSLVPRLAEVFDEPFADSSALPTFLVSELARRHVKVALSGEGGDELFGGYFYYTGHVLARRLGSLAGALAPLAARVPSSDEKASTLENKVRRFVHGAGLGLLERHVRFREVFAPETRAALLAPDFARSLDPVELLRPHFAESDGAEDVARAMDVDLGVYLVEDMLVKTDRASMANSLEARVPILDRAVADLALAVPSRYKVRRLEKKRIIRRAVAPLLPREVIDGPKRGFSMPVASWLRGELLPLAREHLSPEAVRRHGFFRPQAVTRLLDDHLAGRRDTSRELWSLLVFSLWCERYGSGARVVG